MKKSIFILLLGMLSLGSAQAQKYFGKSYAPTKTVDEFYDVADITRAYTVMGKTQLGKGFRSLEKTQQKIMELAKAKGADAVIFTMEEEVYATSTSNTGNVSQKDGKKATVSSSGTTTELKEKKVKATFVKYK